LVPGRYVAFIVLEGESNWYGEAASFEVTEGEVTGLEVKVYPGASISGRVAVEGATDPAVFARLAPVRISASVPTSDVARLFGNSTLLAPDGSFQITGLRPGRATISAGLLPTGFMLLRLERGGVEQLTGIQLAPGEHVTDARLVIGYGTGALRGRVQIEGGALAAGTRLSVSGRRVGASLGQLANGYDIEVDARGLFRIDGVMAGDYLVTITAIQPSTSGSPPPPRRVTQRVTVRDGAETEVTFTLDVGQPEKERRP
jgi:hypothetical protein